MLKTLERYQKCSYTALEPNTSAKEASLVIKRAMTYPPAPACSMELSSQQEYLKLKARYEALQRVQRNLLGEELDPLSSKEVESLERQLDASLNQIRSTRTQHMLDQLSDLQRKEYMLSEANRALKQQLMEGYQASMLQLNAGAEEVSYGRPEAPPPADGLLFHPLDCEPTLHIGYQPDPTMAVATAGPSANNFTLGWLP